MPPDKEGSMHRLKYNVLGEINKVARGVYLFLLRRSLDVNSRHWYIRLTV